MAGLAPVMFPFAKHDPGSKLSLAKPHPPLNIAGVVVEVGIAVAYRAPVEDILILGVLLGEHSVQRFCPAWPGAKDPGHTVAQPIIMARAAAAPCILRLLVPEVPRDDVADIGTLKAVVRNAKGGEEGEVADQRHVLDATRGWRIAG